MVENLLMLKGTKYLPILFGKQTRNLFAIKTMIESRCYECDYDSNEERKNEMGNVSVRVKSKMLRTDFEFEFLVLKTNIYSLIGIYLVNKHRKKN